MESPVLTTVALGEIPALKVDALEWITATVTPAPIGGWVRVTFEDEYGVEHLIGAHEMYDGFVNPSTVGIQLLPDVGGVGTLHARFDAIAPQVDSEATYPVTIERRSPSVNLWLSPATALSDAPFQVVVAVNDGREMPTGDVDLYEVDGDVTTFIGSKPIEGSPSSTSGYAVYDFPARPAGTYGFRADFDGNMRLKPGSTPDTEIEILQGLLPGQVVINGGATTTDNPIVTVDVTAIGATAVQVNHVMDPATIGRPYSPQTQVWLTAPWYGDDSDGLKTVYVRWAGPGNVWSEWRSSTITLIRPDSAKTVQIDQGAAITTDRDVQVSVPVPVGVDPAALRVSNDNQAWTAAPYVPSIGWTLSTGDGLKKVWGSWQDDEGRWTTPISGTVLLDTVAPSMGSVGHRFASGQRVVGSSVPVSFAWTATDTGSGVDHFDIQQRRDGGAWTTVSTSYRRSDIVRQLPTGHTYQFRVRAIDHVGRVGAWRADTTFRLSSYQEWSTRIRYAGTWRTGSAAAYWGLRDRFATRAGSSASMAVTGRGFAWIGSRGPTRGSARIYVNGALVATVNTWAASAQHRQVLYQLRWSTDATRNVRIVVSGTAGHPRVDLDAISVFR